MKSNNVLVLAFLLGISSLVNPVERARAIPPTNKKSTPLGLTGKIAFTSNQNGSSKIWIMNADGTHRTAITGGDSDSSPCFSSDGKKLVFVGTPFGNPEIYVMNLDESRSAEGKRVTFLAIDNLDNVNPVDPHPSFSPDGQKIVFTSNLDANQEIYAINVDGTHQTRLTENGGYGKAEKLHPNSFAPSFSPDGKKIVFVSDRVFHSFGSQNEVFVMNADGTDQIQLTRDGYDDSSPCFSTDGTHITYVSRREGKPRFIAMNANGSTPVSLAKNIGGQSPFYSPDGKHIVYGAVDEKPQGIFVMNADGTHPIRLTSGAYDGGPSWSAGFVPAPPKTPKRK